MTEALGRFLISTPLDSTRASNIPPKQTTNQRQKIRRSHTSCEISFTAHHYSTFLLHCSCTDARHTYSADGKKECEPCSQLDNVPRCGFFDGFQDHDPADVSKTKQVLWVICTFSFNLLCSGWVVAQEPICLSSFL